MIVKNNLILLLLVLFTHHAVSGQEYLTAKVKEGEGAYAFVKRFGLQSNKNTLDEFQKINGLKGLTLHKDKAYKLPIKVYTYDAKSIRTTIGNNDWDNAVQIQKYNEGMHRNGVREKDYRDDNVLWVPLVETLEIGEEVADAKPKAGLKGTFSIFGKDYEEVELVSNKLKGHVYYVVAGHGGPDPGAMTTYKGHHISEDEYAYDVSLRLARNLLSHDATVYVITRDPDDGIRNDEILKMDKDEVCYPNKTMPLNQVARLNQRVNAINALFKKHKKTATKQRAIIIHVDSRAKGQRIDMFFYHNPKSSKGKKLAKTLVSTIEKKYAMHQRGRGYSGTVKGRNLHMLRETYPVAVYAELGNIRNFKDQKRFVDENNRQAVANWLTEGLMNE